jgi:hypothetical protein
VIEVERIERPPLTLYTERDVIGSALFFYIACILLPLAWVATSASMIGPVLWTVFAITLANAFRLLFQQRAFIIDRDREEVRILERKVLTRTRQQVLSLEQLTVWILSEGVPSPVLENLPRRGSILLGGSGRPGILFLRTTGKPNLLEWADRLAADLGCPLYLNIRSQVPGTESFTFQRTPQPQRDPVA